MLLSILEILKKSPSIEQFLGAVESRQKVAVSGLAGSSTSIILGIVFERLSQSLLVVCPDEAEPIKEDIEDVVGAENVISFPDWEVLPYDELSPHEAIIGQRLMTLMNLLMGRRQIIVTPLRAFLRHIIPPSDLANNLVTIEKGQPLELKQLISNLIERGFARVPVVEEVGTFSLRGGIVDIYPPGIENPVRIELLGDKVESLREFDVVSQRSIRHLDRVTIAPAREVVLDEQSVGRFLSNLKGRRLRGRRIEEVAIHVRDRFFFDGLEAYAPIFYSSQTTISSYLPTDAAVVLLEPESLKSKAEHFLEEARMRYEQAEGRKNELPLPEAVFDSLDVALQRISQRKLIEVSVFKPHSTAIHLDFRSPETFGGSLKVLRSVLEESVKGGYRIYILCDNEGQVERLEEIISLGEDHLTIGVGALRQGFVFDEARLKVITDSDIFGRYRRKPRYPRFRGEGAIETYRALNVGDYVVHVNHGIGQYGGVERLTVEGRETECLLVHYAGGDKLYVPIEQLDLLQKYIGKDGQPPSLSRLGGAGWERIKARTKKAIKEMAEELIRIYALRRARPGHAFKPDTHWQKELEASFIYEETPDQLRATEEIKRDMESDRPMDRLVCGDVGYGKTEVAIRAAFKAVMDGKQVAVLVPTTVLAQQHFYTFKERLAEYPVIIEMLSRFRTKRDQKRIIEQLRQGRIDIVIGTHRLLQKDVEFKDLGLLIIDEEQRFGVAHKEAFKKMRATLDVLTLSATPIPRTLHMALLGARDMSIIDTPPKDRLPVETEVVPYDEEIIVNAIMRELDRGGQVFFVHNRVESIDTVAAHVASLVPQARVAVAHGQMKERQLERIMLDFVQKKYDILVSTMIVESGLDIPSVNTIVVNRADTLGLAQLYQLRGRVGRSRHRAYAYLLVPKRHHLTEEQRKRLKTLTEFTALGSGFKIAMRDLEIRGAGNILGPQQSGYIAEVGFDLYCRLLEEAVKEIKGEPIERRVEAKIETDLSAYLPDTYVEDSKQRVIFYKRLVETKDIASVDELESELDDRFGCLPEEARNLLEFQRLRVLAQRAGIARVVVKASGMHIEPVEERRISVQEVERIMELGLEVELQGSARPCVRIRQVPEVPDERLKLMRKVLKVLDAM